jgi:hypothetical protein
MDFHYTWAGPYKVGVIDGPAGLKRAVGSHQVYLWVLDDAVSQFEKEPAAADKRVNVRSIQGFLKTVLGQDAGAGGQIYDFLFRWYYWYGKTETEVAQGVWNLLMAALANSKNRLIADKTKIREFVNIKNVWNYFLLYTWGGYVMDTNVELLKDDPVFPEPDRLKCPRITDDAGAVTLYECGQEPHKGALFASTYNRDIGNLNLESVKGYRSYTYMDGLTPVVDVWLLSAARYHADALRALRHYIFLMHGVYQRYQAIVFGNDQAEEWQATGYHVACADVVVEALLTGMVIESKKAAADFVNWKTRTWATTSNENRKTVTELGLRKTLQRSHI